MQKIKSLEEVAREINEPEIGKFKNLDGNNGYYITNFRIGRGYQLEGTKMYESRYKFARSLIKEKNIKKDNAEEIRI